MPVGASKDLEREATGEKGGRRWGRRARRRMRTMRMTRKTVHTHIHKWTGRATASVPIWARTLSSCHQAHHTPQRYVI